MPPIAGLPPSWVIVIMILSLTFGGTTGVFWVFRRELRESKAQPANLQSIQLENQKKAEEITTLLTNAQANAVTHMASLLEQRSKELDQLKARYEQEIESIRLSYKTEVEELRLEYQRRSEEFRAQVEDLLRQHEIQLPSWWRKSLRRGGE